MRLPIILIVLAVLAAAVVAYGTDPRWGELSHGLDLIVAARRLQGLLEAISLAACVAFICVVISAKRRILWMVGLAPVLALFAHRFAIDPTHHYSVIENAPLLPAGSGNFPSDEQEGNVVGITLKGMDLAFPFAALYSTPVVIEPVHDVRCLVMWSPFANRALAFTVERDLRARDLEVVCMPANALLLYNGRTGQFINGITGRTTTGAKPTGFLAQVETQKMPWSRWHALPPETSVMAAGNSGNAVGGRLSPRYRTPSTPATQAAPERIVLIATTQPVAIDASVVTAAPANISGPTNLLIFRDAASGRVRVFDRRCNGDLFPTFTRKTDPKHSSVALMDLDSQSEWTADGRVVLGPLLNERLRPILAEDDLDWDVMKAWYPTLELVTPGKR